MLSDRASTTTSPPWQRSSRGEAGEGWEVYLGNSQTKKAYCEGLDSSHCYLLSQNVGGFIDCFVEGGLVDSEWPIELHVQPLAFQHALKGLAHRKSLRLSASRQASW